MPTTDRLYEAYASTHAGISDPAATRLAYRRDIRPHLPRPPARQRVLDIGCGQGALVAVMAREGYDAWGVDVSPEQVDLAKTAGCKQIVQGDFHDILSGTPGGWAAVTATDVLEHLTKEELLHAMDSIRRALQPGGVFVARVPNAVSPTGGHIMFGDLTHETWFTRRSVAQIAAVCGFGRTDVFACPPVVHGVASALRAGVWKPVSGLVKLALAAETGQVRGHITTQNLTFVARAS